MNSTSLSLSPQIQSLVVTLQFTRKGKAHLEMILEAWLSGSVNPHFQAYTRVIVTNGLSKDYKIIESNCAQMC